MTLSGQLAVSRKIRGFPGQRAETRGETLLIGQALPPAPGDEKNPAKICQQPVASSNVVC